MVLLLCVRVGGSVVVVVAGVAAGVVVVKKEWLSSLHRAGE